MKAAELISPRTQSAAIGYSIAVHVFVVLAVVGVMHLKPEVQPENLNFVDLGYEVLDAPPVPVQEVAKLKRSPTPVDPVQEKAVNKDQPKEMQDANSDIAGTQKEQKDNNTGAQSDGAANATPYYKIKPKYPRAALASGIEGWVLMKIDITEAGEVENVRVVDGQEQEMFQNEARRAVVLWKYRPFQDGAGNPTRKPNFQVLVSFKLEEEQQ